MLDRLIGKFFPPKERPKKVRGEKNVWKLPGGDYLKSVHDKKLCVGRNCVIHNPSKHKMSDWPLQYRWDRDFFERICEHGAGHPDPDQFDYWREIGVLGIEDIHGCDGCCTGNLPVLEIDG